ncbi:MAG: restriction endonuclease subunit S [Bacteroidaceae bacterium]|nr:restriction endonuclease subunit S [Bacteroidaceae bacterium]
MKGLEVSEVNYSETTNNKDFRIDSQFYTNVPIKNPNLLYKKIGELLKQTQYGISIEMNEANIGYPIYRMNEIHDMLCDVEVGKCADITQDEYSRFALYNRDVLFNRTNSFEWVGRTGMYYQNDNTKRTFASYLVKLVPNTNEILPEYLCTFLNSKFGVCDIKRRARQSINQTNVNPEEVKEIEIPILNMKLQEHIQKLFDLANEKRLESKRLYTAAEKLLLDELGLKDWHPENRNVNIKTLKDSFLSSGRLDAEYYQSKYDEIEQKLMLSNNVDVLGNVCWINTENVIPQTGISHKYIELANIKQNGEISGCTFDLGENLPTRARQVVKENQVMVSSVEGSLQSCALVSKEYDGAFCSTGFYVVKSDLINSETLLVLLKLEPIQQLFKKVCSGTILTAMNIEQFRNVLLPIPNREIQSEISSKIQKSFALKAESKRLLEEAKLMVEKEIEKTGEISE